MQNHSLTELVPILQLAIGPVILISGVGMLLLTFTNRFGRVVDRTRGLVRELAAGPATAQAGLLRAQAEILTRRASILRLSITLAAVVALIGSILAFIRDLNLALAALRIDLRLAPSGR